MMRGISLGLVTVIAAGWVTMGLFSQFQRKMVFPGPEGISESLLHDVATQVGATELRIPTEDGETLYGWHRAAIWSGPRRVVLYFHGNASSLVAQLELQHLLQSEGWDFVGIHYRGYPGSTGVPSEAGLHKDAAAAWKWVADKLDVQPARVAIHGRSLGGGVAVQLAAAVNPGALVLESTFTSIVDLAKEHYRWLPIGRVLEHRFMTRDFAGRVSCPLLVAHGAADSIIDVHHGKELARLFHADEYMEVPRVDHNDMLLVGVIATRYLGFLERAVPVGDRGLE
ncbi:MAG: alpha/beta hydrolase [Deltaproteobacteria bacterium]|nr:alpha/beta hydrolase [Deltaproteobacteria bacterium]MBW1875926.1 alpha/beta hydrolase [Deltaproteobacteria bacterium]MBW2211395.1 alpha/beta hydrolase [Deltaproteobacteria bacterium]MBW2550673.1 alpha/beta hydrolase [Deltaproteobacteria bacterium]MBW2627587.1 alpha/beta hydrolase [Deltaproteobacteria bacterium]